MVKLIHQNLKKHSKLTKGMVVWFISYNPVERRENCKGGKETNKKSSASNVLNTQAREIVNLEKERKSKRPSSNWLTGKQDGHLLFLFFERHMLGCIIIHCCRRRCVAFFRICMDVCGIIFSFTTWTRAIIRVTNYQMWIESCKAMTKIGKCFGSWVLPIQTMPFYCTHPKA